MIFIYTTFPNKKVAKKVVDVLLKEKLIGCANFFNIESIYWWKEKIERTKEVSVILKVARAKKQLVKKRLKELHPCSVPCICEIKVNANKEFLNWLKNI